MHTDQACQLQDTVVGPLSTSTLMLGFLQCALSMPHQLHALLELLILLRPQCQQRLEYSVMYTRKVSVTACIAACRRQMLLA